MLRFLLKLMMRSRYPNSVDSLMNSDWQCRYWIKNLVTDYTAEDRVRISQYCEEIITINLGKRP
jgi:hypothetical protein